ncbi:hypothetical protein IM793_16890 [Pedobacter sp. MR2016-19]|uniref:hypothetical protein n=1 Tax=Pedobacter sp. MR2016-19 TaxID=2780089 RepID=UPI001876D2E3|nr:hypothetical protein [Pedobacter sp. MR2016-19]MBE5320848.1 hypothetical protein [Pedobacter sp. MR2016-19]
MQIKDIIRAQPSLIVDIDRAIKDSLDNVYWYSEKPQEPDFVASLIIDFTKGFYHILRNYFPNNKFGVTGVFTHQKPIVDIGLGKNPELGDLLLVYIHEDMAGKKTFNSILLQAKLSADQKARVASADIHQLELYEKWPDFTYKRAGHLNGVSRKISPKSITDGAQYLLIDDRPISRLTSPAVFPMGTATPNRLLVVNNNFAIEIVEFLKLKSGRTFDEDPLTTTDEWSKMIWDLLEITKAQTKRSNYRGAFDRQSIHGQFSQMFSSPNQQSSFLGAGFMAGTGKGNPDDLPEANDDSGAISILLIESIDQEGEERGQY